MKKVIAFLTELEKNNNRAWFNEHKAEYLEAQERFNGFTELLIKAIARYDENVAGLTAKECTYRIYRDTRFSSDKRPYKCHMGAFICQGGKKSGRAGYYFQVGANNGGWPEEGCMLASGNYCFAPEVLRTLREDIYNGEGDFDRIVRQAPLFTLDTSDSLKRNPAGFPADAPYAEYLRLRTYCLIYLPGKRFMQSAHLAEKVAEAFRPTQPFIEYVNRAIDFVAEEGR